MFLKLIFFKIEIYFDYFLVSISSEIVRKRVISIHDLTLIFQFEEIVNVLLRTQNHVINSPVHRICKLMPKIGNMLFFVDLFALEKKKKVAL